MRVQYKVGTVAAMPASKKAAPRKPRSKSRTAKRPAAKRPVAKRGSFPVRAILASAVMLAAAGCASLDPNLAKAWTIEPVLNVVHSLQTSQAYYTLGRYHDGSQAWDKAIDAYQKSVAADAKNIEAHNALGVALARAGRYAEAEASLRNAVAVAPERAHVRSNLGYVLLLAGKPGAAVTELKVAVKQDGANAMAKANLRDALAQWAVVQRGDGVAATPVAAKATVSNGVDAAPVETSPEVQAVAQGVPAVAQELPPSVSVPAAASLSTTINVAAPITVIEIPAPMVATVSVPMPVQTVSVPAPQTTAVAALPAPTTVAVAAPAMRVIDQPTTASLERSVASGASTFGVKPASVTVPVALPASPIAAEPALRLEVSNGNGVAGMAARVGRWLSTQGENNAYLTNQRPYVQQATVVQYRSGQEKAAQRVARSLPAHAKAAAEPTEGLRSDVRVVLGRDWVQTAACLEQNTCQPAETTVALADK